MRFCYLEPRTRCCAPTDRSSRRRYTGGVEAYVHDAVLDMRIARAELLAEFEKVEGEGWQRFVPYGASTLHGLLAHVAAADHAWALAARGLLKADAGATREPAGLPDAGQARAARERAIARGLRRPPAELLAEMEQRRNLLLGLYDLLEPRHLAVALRAYGEEHNSVRERIWLGYHDRLHAADVRRALRMAWHPAALTFLPELAPVAEALSPAPALYVAFSIDPACWEQPSPVPGWTYRDLLAHIATGDWVLQSHLRSLIEHNDVAAWPDVAAGNAERLHERRYSADRALIEEYLSMRHETLVLLAKLQRRHLDVPIDLWWQPAPNRSTVLGYLRGFEAHDRTHREQLRPAMKYATARGGA
jgi:hypothetical protein